jgi:hypothetical protein
VKKAIIPIVIKAAKPKHYLMKDGLTDVGALSIRVSTERNNA